ncbi:MAG: hypothetical protein NTX25_07435 [Proteobacteria bacterium]|nr:hypothetical protein [Pseudomonadota bacterium]
MVSFDPRDFTKSALSLAAGMFGVALLAAWRSQGDIPTISLTLGLPFGVLAFWALYSLRMKRVQDELSFIREQPTKIFEDLSATGLQGNDPEPLHSVGLGLTLNGHRQFTRMHQIPGSMPIAKDLKEDPDQWHT